MSTPPKKAPRKKAASTPKNRQPNRAPSEETPEPETKRDPRTGNPFAQSFLDAQYKPGHSGNVKGRPKGRKSLKAILEDILDEPLIDPETRLPVEHREVVDGVMTKREALGRMLIEGSLRHNPDRQMLESVLSRIMPKPTVIDATIETTNPKLREAVGSLDAEGRQALRLALGQLGAKSPLDDEPASPDDPVH